MANKRGNAANTTAPAPSKDKKALKATNKEAAGKKPVARKTSSGRQQPQRTSALSAAARVLQERGEPLSCKELIATMAANGYWTSPGGKTPEATLYSAILRELKVKGKEARFCKTARGKFALAAAN